MTKTLGLVSGILTLGSAIFFAMAVHDLVLGDGHTAPGVLFGLSVFFGALTAMCGFATYKSIFAPDRVDTLEPRILALAARSEGRVTVAEVALACAVPLERAEKALDSLSRRGRADVLVSEGGDVVYSVRGLALAASDKRGAHDPSL